MCATEISKYVEEMRNPGGCRADECESLDGKACKAFGAAEKGEPKRLPAKSL